MNGHRAAALLAALLLLLPGSRAAADPAAVSQALVQLMTGDHQQQQAALTELGTSSDARVVPVLVSWATSADSQLRVASIRGLGTMKGLLAQRALLELATKLSAPQTTLTPENQALLESLASFGTSGAAGALLGLALCKSEVSPLAEKLLAEHFGPFWDEARRVLGAQPATTPDQTSTGADMATLLQWLYAGATPELRAAAALALAAMKDPRALPVLETTLMEGGSTLRPVALDALKGWNTPEASAALANCTVAGYPPLRAPCLQALLAHDSLEATQMLLELEWTASHLFSADIKESLKIRLFAQDPARAQARYLPDGGDPIEREIEVLALLATTNAPERQLAGVRRSSQVGRSALPVLQALVQSDNPLLRGPIFEVLASHPDPLAWDLLATVALNQSMPQQDRIRAVEILGRQKAVEPAQRLIPVAGRTQDEAVRKAVRATLKEFHPELLPAKGQKVEGDLAALLEETEEDRSGYIWLAGASAAHGAAAMALVGADGATVLPALSGAILGATLPLWLTANDPRVTTSHALWTFSTGTWALSESALLLSAFGDGEPPGRGVLLALGLVEAGGTLFGALTRKSLGEDASQTAFMNSSWAMGVLGGLGAYGAIWPNQWDTATSLGLMGTGGMVGLLASGFLAQDVHYNSRDALVFSESMALGTWAGGWLGNAWEGDGSGTWGLAILGSSAGYLAASLLGAYEDQREEDTLYQALGAGAGTLMLHGAVSMTTEDSDSRSYALAGGALLGAGVSRLTQDHVRFSVGDGLGTAALSAAGAWTGGWLRWMAEAEESSGAVELGLGVGYAAGATLASFTDLSAQSAGVASGAHVWGNLWGAGLGLVLTPFMDERWLPAVMLPSAWGATAAAIALGDDLGQPKGNLGAMVGVGGGWGAWQGVGLALGLGAESDEVIAGATMLGFSTGLLAGGLTGMYLPGDENMAGRMATGGILGSVIGTGAALLVPEVHEEGVYLAALSLGWAGLALKGLSVPPAEMTFGDYLAIAAGGGWGFFQGAMIADAAGLEDERAAGARILGAGIGLLGGELFARADDLEVGQVVFTELASYSGSGLLSGAYLLSDHDDSAWLGGLSAVGGLAGTLVMAPVADKVRFQGDDVIEYLYLQGWGLWQGLGLASWANASDDQTGGAALLGMSLGFLVPMLTNQAVDYSALDDLLIIGGSVWGTWIGGWMSYALGNSGKDLIPAAAIAGDVGLAGAFLVSLPALGVSRSTLGWMHVGGASGMGLGTAITAIITSSGESIALGMSIGSVAGLIGGALLASGLTDSSPEAQGRIPQRPSDSSASESSGRWTLAGIELPYVMPTTFLVPGPAGHQDEPVTMYGIEGLF